MRPCKWCNQHKYRFDNEKYYAEADNINQDAYLRIMGYEKSVPEAIVSFANGFNIYFQINYCPICGRKLVSHKAKLLRKHYLKIKFTDIFGRMGFSKKKK